MSKTVEDPKKQAILYFIAVLIFSFILWPLLDLFWCAVITHSEFKYNPSDYIIEPIIFSVIATLFFFLPLVIRKKNKDSATKPGKKSKK